MFVYTVIIKNRTFHMLISSSIPNEIDARFPMVFPNKVTNKECARIIRDKYRRALSERKKKKKRKRIIICEIKTKFRNN